MLSIISSVTTVRTPPLSGGDGNRVLSILPNFQNYALTQAPHQILKSPLPPPAPSPLIFQHMWETLTVGNPNYWGSNQHSNSDNNALTH